MFSYVFSCFSLRPWPPALRLGRAWSCHLPPSRNLRAASRKAAPGADHPWCSLPAASSPSGGLQSAEGQQGHSSCPVGFVFNAIPKLRGQPKGLGVSEGSSAAAACWRPEALQEPCT